MMDVTFGIRLCVEGGGGGGPRSADRAKPSHVGAAGRAVGPRRLRRKLLAERAELRDPTRPRRRLGVGPLEGLVVPGVAGVPGGAGLDVPAVGVAAPVALGGDVQAERLGGGVDWDPEVLRSCEAGKRLLAVEAVGRAARVGQGGVETLWTRRGGGAGPGSGSGQGGGGGGGGRWRSARSSRQSAVTQRSAVEALT